MTTQTAQKLHALPKAALVELVIRLGIERNAATKERDEAKAARDRARAYAVYEWHSWDAPKVRRYAQTILDALPADPDAGMHLDTLAAELEAHDSAVRSQPRPLRPGPRCHRGAGAPCMKPLNDEGLCSRHDARQIRRNREQAAA